MQEALKEAYEGISNNHGGPFGAIITKNNKIIGRGHNRVLLDNDCTCHGEIMAIKDACKNLKSYKLNDCQIYTTAEPCPMCLGAILWSGINEIYFGCSKEDTETIGFNDKDFYQTLNINTKKINLHQIDQKECLELFKKYSSIKEREVY